MKLVRREPEWNLSVTEIAEILRTMAKTSRSSSREVLGIFFGSVVVIVLDQAIALASRETITSTFRRHCDTAPGFQRIEYEDLLSVVIDDLLRLATLVSVKGERTIHFMSVDDVVEFQRLLNSFGVMLRNANAQIVWSKVKTLELPPASVPLRFGELYTLDELPSQVVARGLSTESRMRGWLLLLGFLPQKDDNNANAFVNRDLLNDYNGYLKQFRKIKPDQLKLNQNLEKCCEQIEKDIPRLGSELASVSQVAVRNILVAYAIYDADVNYAQGMADFAGAMLVVMREEHLAFACFKKFMQTYRHCFSLDGIGMDAELRQLRARIAEFSTLLAERFDMFGPPIVHSWLLMLFNRQLKHANFCRLLDIYFATQSRAFVVDFAAAILRQNRAILLELEFDETYTFFSNYFATFDFDFILRLMHAKSRSFVDLTH